MRQVNRDELVWNIRFALGRLPSSLLKGMTSHIRETKETAVGMAAQAVAKAMLRYEILSSAPLGEMGDDLFTRAANRGLPLDDGGSGPPPADP